MAKRDWSCSSESLPAATEQRSQKRRTVCHPEPVACRYGCGFERANKNCLSSHESRCMKKAAPKKGTSTSAAKAAKKAATAQRPSKKKTTGMKEAAPKKTTKKAQPKPPSSEPVVAEEDEEADEEEEDDGSLSPSAHYSVLEKQVTRVERMVREDWHDGYEEYHPAAAGWFEALEDPLQAVLELGIGKERFVEGHVLLEAVADSWDRIDACEMRGRWEDCDVDFMVEVPWKRQDGSAYVSVWPSKQGAFHWIWVALLRAAASSSRVKASVLTSWVQAAIRNGVDFSEKACGQFLDGEAPTGGALAAMTAK